VIRVHLLAEVRLYREGIAALLALDDRLSVTTFVALDEGYVDWSSPPDVLVVDASVDGGTETIRSIARAHPEPIVALGVPDDERVVVAFAEAGVLGFVEREASIDDLVESIVSAARREASFPPRIATTLLRRVSALGASRVPDVDALTVRERQIVELIAEGLSNKEIAARLYIEVATVKNHVHNILEKLQVSRRSEAVARLHLVDASETRSTTRSTSAAPPRSTRASTSR